MTITDVAVFSKSGELATGTSTARFPLPSTAGVIEAVCATVGTAPTGQAVVADINLSGATLFPTPEHRPAIPYGANTSGWVTPDITAYAAGDFLTVDVNQVGAQSPGTVAFVQAVKEPAVTSTSFTINRPGSAATGDIIFAYIRARDTGTWSPPGGAGWTAVHSLTLSGGTSKLSVFYRIDNGTPGPWVFTSSGSASSTFAITTAYRGQHATPIDSETLTTVASTSVFTLPAVTTVNPGVQVVSAAFLDADKVANAAPTGHTARLGFDGIVPAQRNLADIRQDLPGAATTPTFTTTGPTINATDSFTGVAGTNLTAHTADTGEAWIQHPGTPSSSIVISNANRVRGNSNVYSYLNEAPSTNAYNVEADFYLFSATGNTHLFARLDPVALTGYGTRWSGTGWDLLRYSAGAGTVLASSVAMGFSVGQTVHVKLAVTDAYKDVYIDGVQVIHYTAANTITATGFPGIRFGSACTDTTGIHIDNFQVSSAAVDTTTAGLSRIGIRPAVDPLAAWTPGADLTVAVRYRES